MTTLADLTRELATSNGTTVEDAARHVRESVEALGYDTWDANTCLSDCENDSIRAGFTPDPEAWERNPPVYQTDSATRKPVAVPKPARKRASKRTTRR